MGFRVARRRRAMGVESEGRSRNKQKELLEVAHANPLSDTAQRLALTLTLTLTFNR